MKPIRILAALAALCAASAAVAQSNPSLPVTTVEVDTLPKVKFAVSLTGHVGGPSREELLRVFAAFQMQYSAYISEGVIPVLPFGADPKLVRIIGTVHDQVGERTFFVSAYVNSCTDAITVRAPKGKTWTLGEQVDVYAFEADSEWKTPAGAVRRGAVYVALDLREPITHPDSPTKERFLEVLKKGTRLPVLVMAPSPCARCLGRGKHTGKVELGQRPDATLTCSACDGMGTISTLKLYDVGW